MKLLLWTLLTLVMACCLPVCIACGGLIWRAANAMYDAHPAPSAPFEQSL